MKRCIHLSKYSQETVTSLRNESLNSQLWLLSNRTGKNNATLRTEQWLLLKTWCMRPILVRVMFSSCAFYK